MENLKVNIYEKPVITKFVTLDNEEFELSTLYSCLNQLLRETQEDDHYGEYSLRAYEVEDKNTMDKLVKLGLVKNYIGSRMANLYCMKDEKGINQLLDTLYELDK